MEYLAAVEHAVALTCAVVTAASAFCALTPTPDPTTAWGAVYRYIEIAGVLVGKAKEIGVVPADPAADRIAAAAAEIAKDVKAA